MKKLGETQIEEGNQSAVDDVLRAINTVLETLKLKVQYIIPDDDVSEPGKIELWLVT